MEKLREQIKNKLRIFDKFDEPWYDFFTLLVFISKYFPSVTGQKEAVEIHVEWHTYDIARLTYMYWPEDSDLDTPAEEINLDFKISEEIIFPEGGSGEGYANEETMDSCLDQLFSSNIEGLNEFLLDYLPMAQLIYICDLDYNEKIYFTDIEMVIIVTGNTIFETELIL